MYKTTNAARRYLLTSVSVMALLGSADAAIAEDQARPVLWIEVGGQLEQLSDKQEPYEPPFDAALLANPFTSPADVQALPIYSFGEEARISFQPEGSSWVFSAGLRYGRASKNGHTHEQTAPASGRGLISIPDLGKYSTGPLPPLAERFATTVSVNEDVHTILDFAAGKDVGLGMLGPRGESTLSAGVRIAQFTSRARARIDSDPDFAFYYKYITNFAGHPANIQIPLQRWNLYRGEIERPRSFKGIGPSIQWDASATLAGTREDGAVTLDWGLNGAVLFGKQKMHAQEKTSALHGTARHASGPLPTLYPSKAFPTARSRSVTVPNLGGFAGLSLRYPNAKLSLGYRVDYFFGAVDGGIRTRKSEDRGFYGPFASISFGMGD